MATRLVLNVFLSICLSTVRVRAIGTAEDQCSVSEKCVVDCGTKGIGPEAPDLSTLIPYSCVNYINELLLNDNAIKTIPDNWMDGKRIKILNLVKNSVSNIGDCAFSSGDCSLERLFLAENSKLGYYGLRKEMFSGLECSLQRLNLDGCQLQTDDLYALTDLELLDQLHLNRNSLTHLPEGVFKKMKNLARLYLSENGITVPFYQQPFAGLTSLSKIDLSKNRLQTVGYCSFGKLPVLNYLYLDKNPLFCNCSLWWMKTSPWSSSVSECLKILSDSDAETCPASVADDCSATAITMPQTTTRNPDDDQTFPDEDTGSRLAGLSTVHLAAVLATVVLIAVIAGVVVVVVVILLKRKRGPAPEQNRVAFSMETNRAYGNTIPPESRLDVGIPALVLDTQKRPLPITPTNGGTGSVSEYRESQGAYEEPFPTNNPPASPEHAYLRLCSSPATKQENGYVSVEQKGYGVTSLQ